MFWMPDQVRHDGFGTFYETIMFDGPVKSRNMHNFVIPVKLVLDPDRGTGIQCF